jgi:hypothetical protein
MIKIIMGLNMDLNPICLIGRRKFKELKRFAIISNIK